MTDLDHLTTPHRFRDSVRWRLTPRGLDVDPGSKSGAGGAIDGTAGRPVTVRRVWRTYREEIGDAALEFQVPAELIIATICAETRGDPAAVRTEPGYVSDDATPHRVSPGLMQTLISTARSALRDPSIDRLWLLEPGNSIRAGTAYIGRQRRRTRLDPPVVAAAYNSGGVYWQQGPRNRWKLRQYPIGTGHHVDRFVLWFNDCFRMFAADGSAPDPSFFRMLNGPTEAGRARRNDRGGAVLAQKRGPPGPGHPPAPRRANPEPGLFGRVFSWLKGD